LLLGLGHAGTDEELAHSVSLYLRDYWEDSTHLNTRELNKVERC